MPDNTSGTLITFDFEGPWGMPHEVPYDLHETTGTILATLRRHDVNAMFFVVGRLVEEEPDLIEMIVAEGHAIGLHGYRHERRLDTFTPAELSVLKNELKSVCGLVENITGSPPVAFRAPYLLWPNFSDPDVSAMLADLGFLWMSNREIRFAEEVFRPGRVGLPMLRQIANTLGVLSDRRAIGSAALIALNANFLLKDGVLGSLVGRLRWLLGERRPFERAGLVEVAIAAPLDCDFLGLPLPTEISADESVAFAAEWLVRGKSRRGDPYVLTFHDWIIGTGNRIAILDKVIGALSKEGPMLDARSWMPRVGERLA